MKKYVIIFLATICVSCIYAKAQALVHPYLIMNMETEQNIRKAIASEPIWEDYHKLMIEGADSISTFAGENCGRQEIIRCVS